MTSSNGKTHSIHFVPQSSIIHRDKRNAIGNKNSNAFEINMHRIPGLSQHFISLCDDFFIGRPLTWKYFFIRTRNSSYYTPRFPLSVFLAYFTSKPTYHVYDLYDTTYDCDITEYEPQWRAYKDNITTVIPSRIEQYFSHQPRPLTKHVMNTFYMKFPKWFAFVESHKRRYCCPNPRKGFMCDRQENMWLTLYKQYVDFEIEVDIMSDPAKQPQPFVLPYTVRPKDIINFYRCSLSMKEKTESIRQIKPYTFSINDHYSTNLEEYLEEFIQFHNFANNYWSKPAVFEVQFDKPGAITWKKLAKNIRTKIKT
eukprot:961292_1